MRLRFRDLFTCPIVVRWSSTSRWKAFIQPCRRVLEEALVDETLGSHLEDVLVENGLRARSTSDPETAGPREE